MVDMGMGQQYEINLGGSDRQLLVFKDILALLHAAVHKTLLVTHLNQRAASRDLMSRAQKRDFHAHISFSFFYFILHQTFWYINACHKSLIIVKLCFFWYDTAYGTL